MCRNEKTISITSYINSIECRLQKNVENHLKYDIHIFVRCLEHDIIFCYIIFHA